jgi:adenylate cyclase
MSASDTPSGPADDGIWPQARTTVLDWLVNETRQERFVDNIFVEFCQRLHERGVPIGRAILILRTNHPQWLGARFLWRPGMTEAERLRTEYAVLTTNSFLNSPVKAIYDGSNEIRQRLDGAIDPSGDVFSIYDDLRQEGLTDYVVWPLQFTMGKRHVVSFAADRPGGFRPEDLALMADLLPALALVTEIRLKNRMARTFLETYVGPHASEQILAGATTRGSGTTVSAVILICDMRGFTQISELWPRDDVIALLNDYFDAMSLPIEQQGGEILKFMGDGLLAVFPLNIEGAFARALEAVVQARASMTDLNQRRASLGMEALGYGIGVHVGDVMYGNIGSRARLDFTVIGPAVNIASRLESLTKEVGRNALFSSTFVEQAGHPDGLVRIGSFPLRGVGEPVEAYGFAERASPA